MNLWRRMITGVLCLIFLFSLFTPVHAKADDSETAYVDVAVATLWVEPGITRSIDSPSLSNPVDLWTWTKSMSYEEKLWLVGNLETQALYGTKVTILEKQGDWVKVAVHGQPTPRHSFGYPGWMPIHQLTKGTAFSQFQSKPFAQIIKPTAWLYHDPNSRKRFIEISFATRLPVISTTKHAVKVMTPSDGAKWLKQEDVQIFRTEADIPAPTGEDVVRTAKQFLGLPYLWAGTSGFGFDCSGFTHTIYKAHGITIPRDSSVQAQFGLPVSEKDLQPGDLLFFAYDQGKGRVHHVGMYIGNGKMIHSPNSSSTVRIDDYRAPGYGEEFAGARRYIQR
ncbi:peptidase P60 [Geobacillus sp. 47C-IIb]|uniref:C40 family peptidase n=1 Tax=Geobacillus TaxID=129337 RepID=UPI0009BF2526|nr:MULTISPECIES: C40 family peptidase [Geobacillus]ATO37746.1 peptidase P60 [Geobacillus thermodenitrificans]OQP09905.1 peptidase P60 [Geobacillus sp. 47C-IIb]QNU32677.1 C40 family peptidase [Geobacillus sp. 47C-IIb]